MMQKPPKDAPKPEAVPTDPDLVPVDPGDGYRVPNANAVANRHALMVIRLRRTGKWHIAFVPKGARFGDPTHIHIFSEYEFEHVQDARAKMREAHAEIRKKADRLRQEVPLERHRPRPVGDRPRPDRGKAVDKKS
jgi:hypothetical protein